MVSDSDEFDIDDFLNSVTAERVQEMMTQAVHAGTMRTFWKILLIQLAAVAIVFVLVSALALDLTS